MSADMSTGMRGTNERGAGSREFILPDLGEGLTEAELISWKVAVGDTVHVDQMVVEVESAKSVVELPCPYAGQITALLAEAGDTVSAGQALLSVAEAGAGTGADDESTPLAETSESSGANLIGYGTSEPKTRSSKRRSFGGKRAAAPEETDSAPAVPTLSPDTPSRPPVETPMTEGDRVSPVSSPLVRKLAKDHGLSAKHLAGTGVGGVVTRADVLAAIESDGAAEHSSATSAGVPTSAGQGERDTRTPITGLRKVVSERLARSRQEIPEATIWLDVDATELLNTKRALEARTGEKYSLLSLVARFVVAGLKKYPIINSSIDTAAGEIVTHGDINLGLAAQTPRGLMVPVVHGADQMSLRQLRDRVGETVGKASTGKFDPSDLSSGTFTLNNYGVFGVDGSAPIINLPEVAMLGLGRIKERPWVVDGELTVRKVMYLSFVFDHRACDGQEPSEFLTFVADCIENPISLLPEL
ncbi:dihydrolipoamide acetyltransferase family protein [Brevibacterium atlanticum]|uniref:dihydrolipoamide acetyltransferase family protein n=1 Tax=Brevibacterium atlanticum TaxID=2697563 RepID=UPI001D18EAB3|nr:dihydrolipoamide acetyltransferase family protein [Brevibacterium atlanticum]